MKKTAQGLISFILTLSIIFSATSSYAYNPEKINILPCKPDISIPERVYDELPEIDVNKIAEPKYETELYRNTQKNEYTTDVPEIQVQNDGEIIPILRKEKIVIPQNRFEARSKQEIESINEEQITNTDRQEIANPENRKTGPSIYTTLYPIDSSYRASNIKFKDSFALQNQTARANIAGDNIGEEYIDPLTGNLIVKETDIVLPGIDGFDFELSRYYSLAQAEVFTKTAVLYNDTSAQALTLHEGDYVVTEEVTNTETWETSTYYYAYESGFDADIRIAEINSRDTCNGLYKYTATCEPAQEGDTITYNYYYISAITSSSYQTVRNNLGVGWSWSFPSIQVIKDDYYSEDFPDTLYYHDGKGKVYEITKDFDGYYFSNYDGKDITFQTIGSILDICTSSRIDYYIEDANCTKYYFGPHGELRTIMDIYGNTMQFTYSQKDFFGAPNMPVLNEITDSVGRKIQFDYTADNDYEYTNVEITSPMESEEEITLSYKKRMVDIYIGTMDGNSIAVPEPVLEKVIHPNKQETEYHPAMMNGDRDTFQFFEFTFGDKYFDSYYVLNTSGYSKGLVYLLGDIVRPHSNTYYYYDICERNLGQSGVCEAYRVSDRGDCLFTFRRISDIEVMLTKEHEMNVVEYDYDRDYTGAPWYGNLSEIPIEEYVCSSTETGENYSVYRKYFKYNDAALMTTEEACYKNPVGNDLNVKKCMENYVCNRPTIEKIIYSNNDGYTYESYRHYTISEEDDKTYGRVLLETVEMDHDTFSSYERDSYGIAYTYDGDTGLILSRSWYNSSDSECIEYFTYDSENRLILYQAPDGSQIQYSYVYSNGKVLKKTTTVRSGSDSIAVSEDYTSATAYAFPSLITKTVTTDNITTSETTNYSYNMLWGIVESITDNDGNKTCYEYDALARPTRIIGPSYSTYSAYDDKDTKMLPIETITYTTVDREYDKITEIDDPFRVQRIEKTIEYYDITDMQTDDITSLEFSEKEPDFYFWESNDYLGTGELIVSKVKDYVGEYLQEITLAECYYDSQTNTVKEIDSKGNVSITQYDGLGREVKFTDQFDNYHITEYNMSSDEAGFKSLSYFVPVSDRDARQNVVENTYDRLGRSTKVKSYSEYPVSAVETKYEYDYVGNITGIIDANNNRNSRGYTQINTYDKLSRVVASRNVNDETICNTYDIWGNIKIQTLKDRSGTESVLYQRSYDAEGKLLTDTDNAGNSNMYTYDNMGRLQYSYYKNDNLNIFEYNELGITDKSSSVIPGYSIIERNYSLKNPHGADVVYGAKATYDEAVDGYRVLLNEITQNLYSTRGKVILQYSMYANSTGYENVLFAPYIYYIYDLLGNITSASYATMDVTAGVPKGYKVHYEYDKNRLSKVQLNGSTIKNSSDSVNAKYEYYDDGKLKSVTFPPLTDNTILKSEYVYDGLSRLSSLINYKGTEIISQYEYTYDNNGNILSITELVNGIQNNVEYTYDKLNRIASVSGTKGADSYYEYDARGNRKANFEQIDFLSEESAIFIYNAEDMLDRSQVGDNITQFDYSANGYRHFKKENSDYPEFYIYDSNGKLHALAEPIIITEADDSESVIMYPTTQYIWGPDRVLAKIDKLTNKSYYYLYNGHGDVVQIVDTSGNVVNQYDYDVWGNFLKKEETIANHFTYFGQTYDETTGLYYLRARYYDPTTGRFTQQDPAEDGYNWYIYGNQNPVMYIDPLGLYYLEKDSDGQVYAVIQSGDTLSGIALSEVGNANAWTKMNYSGEPSKIQVGQRINISGIYDKAHPISIALANSLPLSGKPNSTGKIYNPDGSVKQEREYGPDGQPVKDRDYNHGGANHEFPHEHEWKDGVRGPAQPVPSEFSWGTALLGGLITIVELAGYYYGVPVDLPGN